MFSSSIFSQLFASNRSLVRRRVNPSGFMPKLEPLEVRLVLDATLPTGFQETLVTNGLGAATSMEIAPDGRMFVTIQTGDVRIVKNGALLATPFMHLDVDSFGERGLLSVAFDPNFATNNFLYVYYTVPGASTPSGAPHNRVSRFTANGDVVLAGSEVILLELEDLSASNHNGGAMHFGSDGKLYVAVGDNAVSTNSQTLANFKGKMLRINPDGSFPTDNPFYDVANPTSAQSAIYALGLRNPFTFSIQPGTGTIFINDVGAAAWEEINLGVAGANYGWARAEGIRGSTPTGLGPGTYLDPLLAFPHNPACAITGGTFYNPTTAQFPSSYVGKYFFSDFCGKFIHVLDPSVLGTVSAPDSSSGFAINVDGNPVDLDVDPAGNLYYLSRGTGGALKMISFTGPPNEAPVIAAFDPEVSYTENTDAVLLDNDATVTDADSPNFDLGTLTASLIANVQSSDLLEIRNQGTAAGQIGVSGSDVTFGGTIIGSFTGGVGTTNLVVTFNANATPTAVQALLRNLTYRNDSDTPSTAPKTVRVRITEGDGSVSNQPTKAINVTAVNDPPVIGGFSAPVTYVEDAAPVIIGADAILTDDSANFNGGKLVVTLIDNAQTRDRLEIRNQGFGAGQIGLSGANVTFNGGTIGTFSGGIGTGALIILFNSSASPTAVQALIKNLTFRTITDNPSNAQRTVKLELNDGAGGKSNLPTKIINVTAVNDAPTIGGFTAAVTYVEDAAPLIIGAAGTVTDPDSTNFDGGKLVVTLITNAQSRDRLEIRNEGTGAGQIGLDGANVTFGGVVIGTRSGGIGTGALFIFFNTSATPVAVQALLKNITFRTITDNPSNAERTVRLELHDGDGGKSNLPTRTIKVTAVNDAPVIGGFTGAVSYTEGSAPVVIADPATVTDPDSANFDGGKLVFTLVANAESLDRLEIRNQGTGAGQIGLSGANVTYEGVAIGTRSGGIGTGALIILFNTSASLTAVQALLKNVTYRSVSTNPSTLARTVKVELNDGDGGKSNLPTKTINVTAVNPPPTIAKFSHQSVAARYFSGWRSKDEELSEQGI